VRFLAEDVCLQDEVARRFLANLQEEADARDGGELELRTCGGSSATGVQILAIEAEDGTWAFLSGNRHEEEARVLDTAAAILEKSTDYKPGELLWAVAVRLRGRALELREKARTEL
jgi:hypothetical protein